MGTVLLPIETKSREFYGKVWLATKIADKGHHVLIGDKKRIYSRYNDFSTDVFIEKVAFAHEDYLTRIRDIRSSGGAVVLLDEEGGVFRSTEEYMSKRSCQMLTSFERIFAWGEITRNAIEQHCSLDETTLRTTGNPRFDLLQSDLRYVYQAEAKEITSVYGDYILFNTNFGTGNNKDISKKRSFFEKIGADFNKSKFKFDKQIMSRFIEGIRLLNQEFTDLNIIVRPHPSENHDTYNNEFLEEDGIKVEYSGDVRSWIMGSTAVVHNSCTTGIESALLNVPTIALRLPDWRKKFPKSDLPNIVSDEVYSLDELIELVRQARNSDKPYTMTGDQQRTLKKYFDNIDSKAADAIAEEIDTLTESNGPPTRPSMLSHFQRGRFLKSPYGSAIKKMMGRQQPSQKFEGIDQGEVEAVIKLLHRDKPFDSYEVNRETRWQDLFWISKPKS